MADEHKKMVKDERYSHELVIWESDSISLELSSGPGMIIKLFSVAVLDAAAIGDCIRTHI